jgi:hypothetical protein
MPDRKEQKPVAEQSHAEQATAKLKERGEQARREALRRERIDDLIRRAKAVVTGV